MAANFESLLREAHAAGLAAGEAVAPRPMVVVPGDIRVNGAAVHNRSYFVSEGVCGFAWINVNPGNCALANYLKKNGLARKAYYGGVDVWVSEFGQSMQRKEAYAEAYANVLRAAGHNAHAASRMD